MSDRFGRIATISRNFDFPAETPSHAILGVSMAFNTDRTLFVPLLAAAVRETTSLAGRHYNATGGHYVYLKEMPREGDQPIWFVQEATITPPGEDQATFRERMIDLARPVVLSAVNQGVDPSILPEPSTIEGIADLAGIAIADGAFYLGGVSHIEAADGSTAFGVLHAPNSYNVFEPNGDIWQASAGYLAARIVTQ